MTNVIIIGHGGYGTAMKNNLGMLMGELTGFHYVDFNIEDSLDILTAKIQTVLSGLEKNAGILFACDLTGGTPFRTAAMLCTENPHRIAIAGLNTAAYAEIAYHLDLPPVELAKMALETAKEAICVFPSQE